MRGQQLNKALRSSFENTQLGPFGRVGRIFYRVLLGVCVLRYLGQELEGLEPFKLASSYVSVTVGWQHSLGEPVRPISWQSSVARTFESVGA